MDIEHNPRKYRTNFRGGGALNKWILTPSQSEFAALSSEVTEGFAELKQLINGISSGGVKRIQTGVTSAAATVTIDAVNRAKAFVVSVSKGSAGSTAVNGSISLSPSGGKVGIGQSSGGVASTSMQQDRLYDGLFQSYSGSISGGTTNLTTKQYSAKLISATQLQTDGAVEWQVIEYN